MRLGDRKANTRSFSAKFFDGFRCKQTFLPSCSAPRQIEYDPHRPSRLLNGTTCGDIILFDTETNQEIWSTCFSEYRSNILGLAWLARHPDHFVAGDCRGTLKLLNMNGGSMIYDPFPHLTSVHVNCHDQFFIASGYTTDVAVYDVNRKEPLLVFDGIHTQHINVVKFANRAAPLFASSSFDGDVKLWDLRVGPRYPIYTRRSERGNVMLCFSHDDRFLLVSGVDNEVRQYEALDGTLHTLFV